MFNVPEVYRLPEDGWLMRQLQSISSERGRFGTWCVPSAVR